jgi:alkyldihydroxyacetonephosphate synthase
MPGGDRHLHRWGFADTQLEIDAARSVRMTGSRYPLSGHAMPHLIPFVEETLGCPLDTSTRRPQSEPVVPPPILDAGFMAALAHVIPPDRCATEPMARLAHSHGQLAVGEVDRLLYGGRFARVADLVVEPVSDEEVRAIVAAAAAHNVCLVPFGGGTNVSGALLVPEQETRTVVSIDMRRMCRVLSIDRENNCALVEAGITGADLEAQLGAAGYTCGHTPDSLEFSTLGGWIATNASGMKKNRYGNIEDIVIEATLVTPAGVIETRRPAARTSTGIQPLSLLFGSEGNLGVITRALINIHPKPAETRYGSLVFRTFADGVAFLKALRAEGALPASIRLVNNREFRLGQSLRPSAHGVRAWKSALQKAWLFNVLGFDPETLAACTIVMEGSHEEVARQDRTLRRLATQFRAVWGGADNGRRGYTLTFAIAYLRDFFSDYRIAAESFETSVPWTRIEEVCGAVDRAIVAECQARGVTGNPYLSYRVTQTYHAGVCVYFTMAFYCRGLADPGAVFHEVEQALRQVVLDHGGSLSHHHGVGKIRQHFLPQVHSPAGLEAIRGAKRGIDPANIFGIGNGACGR